jgi:hypothetical protein
MESYCEIKVGDSMHEKSRRRRWSYILSGLVYLGFAIQIAGISLTDRNLKPRIVPTPIALQFVGSLGLVISFAAPFLSLAALAKARSDIASTASAFERSLIWTIVILAVLGSLPEWLWSCGGHPTWYQGFAG